MQIHHIRQAHRMIQAKVRQWTRVVSSICIVALTGPPQCFYYQVFVTALCSHWQTTHPCAWQNINEHSSKSTHTGTRRILKGHMGITLLSVPLPCHSPPASASILMGVTQHYVNADKLYWQVRHSWIKSRNSYVARLLTMHFTRSKLCHFAFLTTSKKYHSPRV